MMFYEEIFVFLVCVLPYTLSTSCMPKCGIPSEWLPVARNVCYGTKGDTFGKFTMDKNCKLFAIRFSHFSGFQSSMKLDAYYRSRWGHSRDEPNEICTLLLKNRKVLIPRKVEHHGHYSLDGFKIDDDVIVVKQNETLSTGQELEIAYCHDFKDLPDLPEDDNEGTHCVNVDVSCYV